VTKVLIVLTLACLCQGCSSVRVYNFRVNSNPQGCPVEVDGTVFGYTPTTVPLSVSKRWVGVVNAPGGWEYRNQAYIVKCYPPPAGTGQNLVSQTKRVFITPGVTPAEPELYFDLTLESVAPTQNINVNTR
jgi:hypothetical protein